MTHIATDKSLNIISPKLNTIAKTRIITGLKEHPKFKKINQSKTHKDKQPADQTKYASKRVSIICCKSCRNILTKDEFSITVEGYHEHMQCNPYGITFVFRCFNEVWNTLLVGCPQSADSWFNAYNWTLVCCNQCQSHLGWYFSASNEQGFWGLISDHLTTQAFDS